MRLINNYLSRNEDLFSYIMLIIGLLSLYFLISNNTAQINYIVPNLMFLISIFYFFKSINMKRLEGKNDSSLVQEM